MTYKSHAVALLAFAFSTLVQAQGLPMGASLGGLPQGLSAQDLNAMRGGASGLGGAGVGLGGGIGIGGLLGSGLIAPSMNEDDTDSPNQNRAKPQKIAPLPPNDFQKYVVEVTGQPSPLYGADFFENTRNDVSNPERSPVTSDYVLGAGDELLIRTWGSTSSEYQVTLDRNGEVSIPKLGTVKLAGVKASQVQGVMKSLFARHYKDFEISVSLGKLRKITVYVVGQSRSPGSYTLSSQSTLTTALFASGGPNGSGSVRRVQLKRQDAVVSEFDLYNFLSKGDKSADVKLLDGDVIYFPRAAGYMAFMGKVNTPGVYEIKDGTETVGDFLNLAGGLPVVADPRRATLERLTPDSDRPRNLEGLMLDVQGLKKVLRTGDIVSVSAIVPELTNSVTLRGNVAQPTRLAWRSGMRVSDVITRKSLLMSPDSARKHNEALFDVFDQERTARNRARVPADLVMDRKVERLAELELEQEARQGGVKPTTALSANETLEMTTFRPELQATGMGDARRSSFAQEGTLVDRIGDLLEEVNLDYAVVERISREDMKVSLIPFNLGRVLASVNDPENLLLEPGDVITVFSVKDLRIPVAKRRTFVRLEGEVQKPGVYPVLPGENLVHLIKKAGGLTPDAYVYGISFYRQDVKSTQQENLQKILRRVEAESAGALSQAIQSVSVMSDDGARQAKIQSLQQSRRQTIERIRSLKPEGRISLDMPAQLQAGLEVVPQLRLSPGDRVYIPPRPNFVYVFGSVSTEAALIYKDRRTVAEYLQLAGSSSGADRDGAILIRADGSALTNRGYWGNEVLSTQAMPGDAIVVPEKMEGEPVWSSIIRNTKDLTQVLLQLGMTAATIHVLRTDTSTPVAGTVVNIAK